MPEYPFFPRNTLLQKYMGLNLSSVRKPTAQIVCSFRFFYGFWCVWGRGCVVLIAWGGSCDDYPILSTSGSCLFSVFVLSVWPPGPVGAAGSGGAVRCLAAVALAAGGDSFEIGPTC